MKLMSKQLLALAIFLCFASGCATMNVAGTGTAEKINWSEYLDC